MIQLIDTDGIYIYSITILYFKLIRNFKLSDLLSKIFLRTLIFRAIKSYSNNDAKINNFIAT